MKLPGDWRSGAYGANRRAHLYTWGPWGGSKRAACGAPTTDKYAARATTGKDACYDCLAYAASGRYQEARSRAETIR